MVGVAGFFFLFFAFLFPAFSQSTALTCSPSAVPTLVRSEGVAERIGDILLQCSGGAAGTVVTGNLSLFLPVSVTNRVNADNVATDVSLVVESGSTPLATVAGRVAGQSITFNGVSFTMPASGGVTLRISNLRANASQLGASNNQRLQVSISTTLGSRFDRQPRDGGADAAFAAGHRDARRHQLRGLPFAFRNQPDRALQPRSRASPPPG